jgi:hypothetical protein
MSSSFTVTSGVRQGCPISPFLFNFVIDDILQRSLEPIENCGVELIPGTRVADLDYADDIALVGENSNVIQSALSFLALEVSRYGMAFAPSKCKVLLQDWQDPPPALTLAGDSLEFVNSFVYLGSCIAAGGYIGDEIGLRIAKARLAFANLRHLWRRRDVKLALKGRVYKATVRAVLLYGCEAWPAREADLNRLAVFENRCLRSITRVWWHQHVSNADVRSRIFVADSTSLKQVISLRQLRWLGHVLRMQPQRLPHRTLFALAGANWKNGVVGSQ